MEKIIQITSVFIDITACLLNLITFQFVFKSFNIRKHVFALLFLDSLNCCICAIFSTILDTILLSEKISELYLVCSVAFLVSYLPNSLGAILTLIIAVIRYTLALKSAKNIHPSDAKVTNLALGIFIIVASTIISCFIFHFELGFPTAYFIDACAYPEVQPRQLTKFTTLFLIHPNVVNFLSLVTDIQMLIFLSKVIMPSIQTEVSGGAGKILLMSSK